MFFIRDPDGTETGPFSADTVKGWIESGACNLFTTARREDQKRWRVLGAFNEFSRVRPGTRPAATAQSSRLSASVVPAPAPPEENPFVESSTGETPPPDTAPPPFPRKKPENQIHRPKLREPQAPPRVVEMPAPPPLGRAARQPAPARGGKPDKKFVPLLPLPDETPPEPFSLPKWAWTIWGVIVGLWFVARLAQGHLPVAEVLLKFLLVPWLAAFIAWTKLEQRESTPWVFLGVFFFLFVAV